jgi:hypothetical protein
MRTKGGKQTRPDQNNPAFAFAQLEITRM